MGQDGRRLPERVQQVVVLDRQHRLGRRQRHKVEARLDDQAQGAFRTDDQLREVERRILRGRGRPDEGVEVVAADAPQDLRIAPVDLRRVPPRQPADGPVARPLQGRRGAGGVQVTAVERPQVRQRAVGERHVQIEDMVDRLAVQHRPRAARVVGDHPADGGAAGGGDVRCEPQPVRGKLRVQLVEHDARLDPRPALLDVHLQKAVEVLRGVQLQPRPDRLAGLRRAAAAGGDGTPVRPGAFNGGQHVVARADDGDAERLDPVDARVGRVQRARDHVEAHLASEPCFEIRPQTHPPQYMAVAGGGRTASSAGRHSRCYRCRCPLRFQDDLDGAGVPASDRRGFGAQPRQNRIACPKRLNPEGERARRPADKA